MKKKASLSNPGKYSVSKTCYFCTHKDIPIDYKNVECLKDFTTKSGKILPRRITGTCAKHHRLLTREIKLARVMALLPFTRKY